MRSYPRGTGIGLDFQEHGIGANMKGNAMELGKARICREGKDAAVIAYGSSTNEALEAADVLEQHGVSVTVVDARFCKPLDTETVCPLPLSVLRSCPANADMPLAPLSLLHLRNTGLFLYADSELRKRASNHDNG